MSFILINASPFSEKTSPYIIEIFKLKILNYSKTLEFNVEAFIKESLSFLSLLAHTRLFSKKMKKN